MLLNVTVRFRGPSLLYVFSLIFLALLHSYSPDVKSHFVSLAVRIISYIIILYLHNRVRNSELT